MAGRLRRDEFIKKVEVVHGNKYNYSQITYIYSSDKVPVVCPIYNKFEQTPTKHLSVQGCRKCGFIKAASKCRMPKKKFV